jgi:Flp pilus assembly protein TadG
MVGGMMSKRRTFSSRTGAIGLALLIGFLTPSAEAQLTAQQKADIGFTSLQQRLGAAMPTGANLSVRVVEAPDGSGNYGPNTADAQLSGKTFEYLSGATGTLGHATTVSRYLFGSQSLAPAIGNTAQGQTAAFSEANNWLGTGYLRPAANQLPLIETRALVNHSWVGTTGDTTSDTELLRRADYAVQRDGTIATYALNNGSNTTIPSLLASTYNGIVVGRSDGGHSRGTTTINGSGRVKPDIVVPTNATSWATPTVSSAAGLLVETARVGAFTNGDRPQVVKSLLMAGATKAGDTVPGSWNWSNSQTQPLDSIYGAGQLNIENAYDILTAGRFAASGSALAGDTGWDFGTASSILPQRYFFDVIAGGDLTASLNWQITVTATQGGPPVRNYSFSTSLANLDLRLYSASGFTLGSLVKASLSTVDNTELIWATGLAPGRYALEVSSGTNNVDYGLAWTVVVPEPGTWLLLAVAVAGGVAVQARRRARRVGPSRRDGLSAPRGSAAST